MTQDLCHGKVDITRFSKIQSLPNPTLGARSTESGKNDKNKPKCWKIANNGYPAYHLCAQSLPNPYHEFPESLRFFEEGNFVYDKVLSVRQELIQLTGIRAEKLGKIILECRKQSDYPTSWSCSFCTEVRIA
jgi:hypothetical protein